MAPQPVEVVIVGGGPAGAAAARLLAAWGHSVQLLTKTADRSRSLGESLPPSCRKLFDLLGATAAIDAAGFLASSGNTVWWGEQTTRTASFTDGTTGLQVERRDFDALLLRLAAEAGANSAGHSARTRGAARAGRRPPRAGPQRRFATRPATRAPTPSRHSSSSTVPAVPASSHAAGSVCTMPVARRSR